MECLTMPSHVRVPDMGIGTYSIRGDARRSFLKRGALDACMLTRRPTTWMGVRNK
jgi:hypothetical protein